MKFSTNVQKIKETAKSHKISTGSLEIETKKKDCTIANAKDIISLLQAFHIYIQILVFSAIPKIKFQPQFLFDKYVKHVIML